MASAAVMAGARQFGATLADSTRTHAPIAWFVLLYAACGLVLSAFFGRVNEAWPPL
jgi:hypothetical protein